MSVAVCTALGIEARAIRRAWPGVAVVGMRARRLDRAPWLTGADWVLLLGFGGGLHAHQRTGDIVVANAVHDGSSVVDLPAAPAVAAALRRAGLPSSEGSLFCADHIVRGRERAELSAHAVVDMESGPLARLVARRLVVVRVLVDTPTVGLVRASLTAGRRARRRLRAVAATLATDDFEPDGVRVGVGQITSGTVQRAAPLEPAPPQAARTHSKEG